MQSLRYLLVSILPGCSHSSMEGGIQSRVEDGGVIHPIRYDVKDTKCAMLDLDTFAKCSLSGNFSLQFFVHPDVPLFCP